MRAARLLRALICVGLLAFPLAESRAQNGRPKVAIGEIQGPTGAQLGYSIERALRGKVELVSNRVWEEEAGRLGVSGTTVDEAAQVGRALKVDAAVIGEVVRAGRTWQANIQLVQVRPGSVAKTWSFDNGQLRALSKVAKRQAWIQLQGPIRVAAAAPAAGARAEGSAAGSSPDGGASSSPRSDGPKRVVMMPFDGGRMGNATRIEIARTLNDTDRVEFFRLDDAQRAAANLGVSMDDPVGRIALSEMERVDAYIEGRTFTRNGQYYGAVYIHQGVDGEPVEVLKLRRRTLKRLQQDLAERSVPAVLDRAQRAGVPEPEGEGLSLDLSTMEDAGVAAGATGAAQGAAAPAEASGRAQAQAERRSQPRGADRRTRTPLQMTVGFRSFSRRFAFNDPLTPSRDYNADFLPAIALAGSWFPAAHFVDEGMARNIGIFFRADYAIGLSSEDATSDASFPTNSFALVLGGRFRVPLGASELGFELGYGTDRFSLDADAGAGSPVDPGTPNAEYEFVRLAADGRWRATPWLDLGIHGGYRLLTTAGQLSSEAWFPNMEGGGIEGGLSVGTPVLDPLHLELGFDVNHHFFSFNPEVGASQVAGGALDQYFTGSLRAVFVL